MVVLPCFTSLLCCLCTTHSQMCVSLSLRSMCVDLCRKLLLILTCMQCQVVSTLFCFTCQRSSFPSAHTFEAECKFCSLSVRCHDSAVCQNAGSCHVRAQQAIVGCTRDVLRVSREPCSFQYIKFSPKLQQMLGRCPKMLVYAFVGLALTCMTSFRVW